MKSDQRVPEYQQGSQTEPQLLRIRFRIRSKTEYLEATPKIGGMKRNI